MRAVRRGIKESSVIHRLKSQQKVLQGERQKAKDDALAARRTIDDQEVMLDAAEAIIDSSAAAAEEIIQTKDDEVTTLKAERGKMKEQLQIAAQQLGETERLRKLATDQAAHLVTRVQLGETHAAAQEQQKELSQQQAKHIAERSQAMAAEKENEHRASILQYNRR